MERLLLEFQEKGDEKRCVLSSLEANLEIGFALGKYSQNKLLREGGKQDREGEEAK